MEHCKRHVTHVALSALHHLHVNAKRVGKLSWKERIALFKAIDENLKRSNHGGAVGRYDLTFGCKFPFGITISVLGVSVGFRPALASSASASWSLPPRPPHISLTTNRGEVSFTAPLKPWF